MYEQGSTGKKYSPNYQFQLRVYWIYSRPRFRIFDAHQTYRVDKKKISVGLSVPMYFFGVIGASDFLARFDVWTS